MARARLKPLVAVIGATGTGKSDLAVEIARRFDGEIINGDAMQLYHGLPIITNKISQEEMKSIPHHLLGRIGLEQETWTVGKFVSEAMSVIDEIRSRGKLPILVGGTHYYTQSLLFHDALADEDASTPKRGDESFPILNEPTDVILSKLKDVDPVMADRWHPNDRRKIQRSLEIYLRTGKAASQLYSEQRTKREVPLRGSDIDSTGKQTELRFSTLLLWVHANKDALYPRLDGRVEKMLKKGLLSEVQELSRFAQNHEVRTDASIDQSRGIWVSIGYKEFLDYQCALTDPSRSAPELAQLKMTAVEKTQAATRQYANRQIRWIRIKLLNAMNNTGQKDSIFLFDGSDLSKWEEEVVGPATTITKQFLCGEALPAPSSLSAAATEMLAPRREYDLSQRPDLWTRRICERCGTFAVTENEWVAHIKSRAHRKAVGAEKKKQRSHSAPKSDRRALQGDVVDLLETYMEMFPESDEAKADDTDCGSSAAIGEISKSGSE